MLREDLSKVHAEIETNGYVILNSIEESEILGIAYGLGQPIPDSRTRQLVRPLIPVSAELAPGNTLSSRYGTGAFPFHTETAYQSNPIRYLMLYCVRPGFTQQPTLLSDLWYTCTTETQRCLTQDIWLVYRNANPFLTRIAEKSLDAVRIRFDPECMRPAHRSNSTSQIMQQITPNRELIWQQRNLLIVDNHRMLHARGDSPMPDEDRLLLRVLVKE